MRPFTAGSTSTTPRDPRGSAISTAAVAPLFAQAERQAILAAVKTTKPIDYCLPGYGWTLKKLRHWVESKLERKVSRNTLRTILHQAGLSWKTIYACWTTVVRSCLRCLGLASGVHYFFSICVIALCVCALAVELPTE